MSQIRIHSFEDSKTTAEQLGVEVFARLKAAIASKGSAILVVSGGSTPVPFFEHLAEQPLEWSRLTVLLADERCVAVSDEASNARLVQNHLLTGEAQGARFINIYPEHSSGDAGGTDPGEAADQLVRDLPEYDVVVLGMGNDGHTASIFPKADERDQALSLAGTRAALQTDPKTVAPLRITQTRERLLNTEFLALHLTGEQKLSMLNRIMHEAEFRDLPMGYFLHQDRIPIDIYQCR